MYNVRVTMCVVLGAASVVYWGWQSAGVGMVKSC